MGLAAGPVGLIAAYWLTYLTHGAAGPVHSTLLHRQANAGNLAIRRAPWNRPFLEELQDFPNGAKDDQVDALSRAFAMMTDTGPPARRTNVPLFSR